MDGPLARVRDGDRVVIDVDKRQLDLMVSAEELAKRPAPSKTFPKEATGWLGMYRRDVQAMSTGAVLIDMQK